MKRMLADVCPELINEWSQRNLPLVSDPFFRTNGLIDRIKKIASIEYVFSDYAA